MDHEQNAPKTPARRLAETCDAMDKKQIESFLEEHGFPGHPETILPERFRALEDFRDEFCRERRVLAGAETKSLDRQAFGRVCSVIAGRQRWWEDACRPNPIQRTARLLAESCLASDRSGIEAFLAENGFPGEPETWSEEQAQALLDFQEQWFSPAWDEYVE